MGEGEPHPFDPEAQPASAPGEGEEIESPESGRQRVLAGEFRNLAATVDESLATRAPFVEADNSEARRLQEALRIYQGDLDKFGPLEEQDTSFLESSIRRLRDSLAETAELIRKSAETKTEIKTLLASPAVRDFVEAAKERDPAAEEDDDTVAIRTILRRLQELIDDSKELMSLTPDDLLLRGSIERVRKFFDVK